uniref:Pm27 n=1 Tax=Solanum tuberosum TaxID=4113 RepID=M1C6X0_SOLTU
MAKGTTGRRRNGSRRCRATPYPLPSANHSELVHQKKCSKIFEKKDWEDATCSVCMEYPHNAVLLLCSSHDKGCRPYMCGTSLRYSNCLDQYKKAYTKAILPDNNQPVQGDNDTPTAEPFSTWPSEKSEVSEVACPLCRGQVKGWTVVEPAREYLNSKKRSCMQDDCSFVGSYKEIRKHVKAEHPCARPHDEEGFDANEMMNGNEGFGMGIDRNLMNVFLFLQAFGSAGNIGSNRVMRRHERDISDTLDRGAGGVDRNLPIGGFEYSDDDSDNSGDDNDDSGMSLVGRLRREGRVLLGRSGRRRRRREANAGRR